MDRKTKESLKDLGYEPLALFWEAWFWMLGAGALHATYHAIPPVGYWTAVLASFFFGHAGTRGNIYRRVRKLTDA